ncbi:hypothetical protein GCM10025867_50110 (plasmid) [Frondihabitans sucicola]|uniref:RNB domain-containing protein n=1 Tax=Frondihabitans sucicola TaxID=1268041 RepID=A0ABM8GWG8_9MICO|nr:ribonuclease catalytic domain-containing protein [Frondihabitans sucicola]BDZ52770.1 hypothetical protein GCM10025867_50110 [Frondihabitans sucicola]
MSDSTDATTVDRAAPRVYMIDSPTTRDRDDAFRVDKTDTGYRVTVHVARVADHVPLGSDEDLAARAAGWTLYGPRRVTPMLGETIEDLATLKHQESRPTVAIQIDLSETGEVVGRELRRDIALNPVALTYASATTTLDETDHRWRPDLITAHHLAMILLDRRRNDGALALYDLADGWTVTEEGVLIPLADIERNVAYVIVQEMMIVANAAVAAWAAERELPILYRNHQASAVAPSLSEIAQDIRVAQNSADPAADFRTLRQRTSLTMKKATYGPRLLGHYGLSLPSYTHSTSPLRRYADLVTQRQLLAALDERELPYSAESLTEIAESLRETAALRSAAVTAREKAKDVDRTLTAVGRANSLADLSTERWLKTLKLATKGPYLAPVAIEVRRRIDARLLDHQDAAYVLGANDSWRELKLDLLTYVDEHNPAMASMLLNQYQQQNADALPVTYQESQDGPRTRRSSPSTRASDRSACSLAPPRP